MQPVSVAISDTDSDRRIKFEHSLRNETGVKLLTNITSSNDAVFTTRREKSRESISVTENEVARAKRLNPRVLLVDSNLCSDASMLESLRQECPGTFVVLLVEDENSMSEDMIIQAMEAGVRGYLSRENGNRHLSKVAQVVERGEIWAPRRMLGKIMDRVLRHELSQ